MSQQTPSSPPTDALNPARLLALQRVELIARARRRSQHIHAASAAARHGVDSQRAMKARALFNAQEHVAASVQTRRQQLELAITAPTPSETPNASETGKAAS